MRFADAARTCSLAWSVSLLATACATSTPTGRRGAVTDVGGRGSNGKPAVEPAANRGPESSLAELRFLPPPLPIAQPEDAIVRIVGPQVTCTGTLIDEDLVLSAHHCVVRRTAKGGVGKGQISPTEIHVELGGDYLAWGTVQVAHIVTPPCGEAGGGGDISVLVLERKLVGIGTMRVRLDRGPKAGEWIDPSGFGRCAASEDAIRRKQRPGGRVRAVAPRSLELQASICPGDSGGPLVARATQEVVGVISMSAMDGDERTSNRTVGARIDAFRQVIAQARLIGDGLAPRELPPLSCTR